MFKVFKKEIELEGKKISLETGKIARQADGSIIAKCGETIVMATVVGAKKINPDVQFKSFKKKLTSINIDQIAKKYDLIVDGSDISERVF